MSDFKYIGNIDLDNRKVFKQKDGSISTENSITVDFDDGTYVIPTIIDGKQVDPDTAIEYFRKTGKHLGRFDANTSRDFVEQYANSIHLRQEKKYVGKSKLANVKKKSVFE